MNERNVDAITAFLVGEFGEDWGTGICPLEVARLLASHGVLVPSVLTDEDLGNVYGILEWIDTPGPKASDKDWAEWDTHVETRKLLERIAKGESAP